jgi:ubiquinone/menaquinone biosynthesis C-methylase UbiE
MYQSFARSYDSLMDNIPYDEWVEYIKGLLTQYGAEPKEGRLLLELGCGTGNVTERLASFGYDMIGVDNSEDMLMIAEEKKRENSSSSLYLLQDMTDFELFGTVAAAVSICDSMNYLLEYEDLVTCFKLVNNYLDPEGVFIFDMNTKHYFRDIVGENTISEVRDDMAFIWDNSFDKEENMNYLYLTLFQEDKESGEGAYRRFDELHEQRAYEIDEVKRALEEAGMEFVTAFDAFTENPPSQDSQRIYIIAREYGKG